MGIFDIFKKSRPRSRPKSGQRSGKPVEKAKLIQAGPPTAPAVHTRKRFGRESKKVLAGKPIPKRKDLKEVYRILKEPHISEKATQLSDKNKYTFKVYSGVNKIQIAKAIASLYGVKVKDVHIINIKSKKRILRGFEGRKAGYKKAIVTLEKGYKIELLPH